jgi:sulfite reductase (NADPH) flavoprotein alpha-component
MSLLEKPPAMAEIIPATAPFSEEQRQWLNGFFAGLLSLDNAGVTPLAASEAEALLPEAGHAPWHDPAMSISDRMGLADGLPLDRRLFAAMAQQDCGQCGYLCETYSAAIAGGNETRLNLCAPGGKETFRQVKVLMESAPATLSVPAPAVAAQEPASTAPVGTARENPAKAVFLSRKRLNGPKSEKETWHLEFDITPNGLSYEAGDSFGVFVKNDPRLVDAVIALLGARPDEELEGGPFRTVLLEQKALGPAPDALFQLISLLSGGTTRAKARQLANGEDPDGDLERLDVLGTLHKFASVRMGAEAFVEALDDLQPRLYSISSSPKKEPGTLSLTVDAVRYAIHGRPRLGVASTYFAERLSPGETLPVYVQKAHGFSLPNNPETPIIMVGPGTGIAPFRAFLQEREATKAAGKNWLFFGHQRSEDDFFYRKELEAMQESGHLTRLSLAWSRDASEKFYVQDRMRQSGAELAEWLAAGAHFYVCGDAKRMARDVERALTDIIAEHGAMTAEAAAQHIAALKKAGRYQADIY